MRLRGLFSVLGFCLIPAATAADQSSLSAIGFICSAEQDAPAAGSVRRLVMQDGMGTGGFAIATDKPDAQAWFDYGMKLAHAFYHADAAAAFKKAREIDPDCAMCAWGEAWANGPTINFDVDDAQAKADRALADKAALMAEGESPKNKALIAALQRRYAHHNAGADLDFAKAMDALSRQYPDDDEIAVLTSDAWMIPWSLHGDHRGLPRAVAVLEPVLARHPDNTGAIHFYIHATEGAGVAAKALPYAERLGALAPGASHLVHMASHTYFRVGRYQDAAISNARAIGVDGTYLRAAHDASPQGKVTYHGHDLRFGLAAVLVSGDGPLAERFAAHAAFAYPAGLPRSAFVQLTIGDAHIALARADPAKALASISAVGETGVAAAMDHYARGEAFAAQGDAAGVRAEASMTKLSYADLAAMPSDARRELSAVIEVARLTLQGRAAMLQGDSKAAVAAYQAAARLQDAHLTGEDFMDPPAWWFPERRSLAAALLAAGRPAEAVAEARKALAGWPHDPLTLQVLGQAETAAGDIAAGERDLAEARQTWRGGNVTAARL